MLRELKTEIKRLITMLQEGRITEDELKSQLRRRFKNEFNSIEKPLLDAIAESRRETQWNAETMPNPDYVQRQTDDALKMIEARTISGVSQNERSTLRYVYDGIKQGIDGNLNWADTVKEALRKLDYKEYHIQTEINTNQAAIDRSRRILSLLRTSKDNGNDIFVLYEGPKPQRKFCKLHYGRVFSVAEILKMENGFGQPAAFYMGGYNCTHRWDPVSGRKVGLPESSKGSLFLENGFKASDKGNEIEIAKMRAEQGVNVMLKAGNNTYKTSDAYENGENVEYKRISKTNNLGDRISDVLRAGKKQSRTVLVYIDMGSSRVIEADLLRGVESRFRKDIKKELTKVIIMLQDGASITKERTKWE